MLADVRVILLVEDDKMDEYLSPHMELKTLRVYGHINEEMDFHTTKIRRAFRHLVPFSKEFQEPMSIGVKVILLVGHDKTLHVPCKVGNSK